MRKITYAEAIREALFQAMEKDNNVYVYGIGVDDSTAIFGSTKGLSEKFGKDRVFDTPLSEDAMTGFGLGSAINEMKPIHIHARADFALLAVNQIMNMISCMKFGSNGQLKCPMVIRIIIGRGWGQGFQHSKSLYSIFAHIPGLKVVAPTSPYDAKGMLLAAIEDPGPVIMFEHRWLYYQEGEVPEEYYIAPLSESKVVKKGDEITIIGVSWMVIEALKAAELLKKYHNMEAEVIDVRSVTDFNDKKNIIMKSVKKTRGVVIADNDWLFCGLSSEILSFICEQIFEHTYDSFVPSALSMPPIVRLGFKKTHCPTARHLENKFYPNAKDIVGKAEQILCLDQADLSKEEIYSHEKRFKGPF